MAEFRFAINQINADTTLLISTISEGTSRQQRFIEIISENLVGRQLSLHEISHDDYDDILDDVETMSYDITGEKYVKKNMRTSARTIQAANRLVLIESSQGSDGPSQYSLESIGGPHDSPENVAPGQQRRSSESMQHYRTMLLIKYTGYANACFGNRNYDSCLNGIERAMEQGELRYIEHQIPFDTYLELELLRIEVYQQQSSFSHGERLLSDLIYKVEQAQSHEVNKYQITSEGRGKLYLAMAQLHLKRYRETGDRALLSGVLETAKQAYEFSITEQEHNPEEFSLTELNTRCASSLIRAAELNGDHVLADVIRISHPTLVELNEPQLDEAVRNEPSVQNILISLIESGNLELARYFAQIRPLGGSLGEILEVVDSSRLTPLLLAARNRNYPIFRFLLENGANIAATDCRNLGVLHYALIGGDGVELVQMLGLIAAHKEIDLNVIEAGHTALTYCAKTGYCDAAKALLEVGLARPQKPINLEKMNSHGETAAFIASRRVDVRMMKLLYSKGAKFNRKNMDKRARAIIQGWAKG
jgi:ankyrin repeat protein